VDAELYSCWIRLVETPTFHHSADISGLPVASSSLSLQRDKHENNVVMPSEQEFHERWGFLRPWCAPFSIMGSYYWEEQVDGQPRDCVIRVHEPWGNTEASSNSMRAIRDALVLLTLLLRVDPFAWFGVLAMYCELDGISHPLDDSFDCDRVRFQLVVNATTSDWNKATLPGFFSAMDSEPSREFVETVDQILGQQPPMRTSSGELEVRVGVDFKDDIYVKILSTGYIERHLRFLRSLCAKYDGWRFPVHAGAPVSSMKAGDLASNAPTTCVLVVEPVRLHVRACVPVSRWATLILDDIATAPNGPAIDEVKIGLVHTRAMTVADEVLDEGRLFQRLLCRASVKYSRMSFTFEGSRTIDQVCTALAQTQSGDSIEISRSNPRLSAESAESCRSVWLGVAYAFFSKLARARSSVSKVTLSNFPSLTMADVEAIAMVVASNEPAHLLFGGDRRNSDPSRRGNTFETSTLRKGTTVILERVDNGVASPDELVAWVLESDVSDIQVLEYVDDGFVRALVPGYGVCYVPEDGVLQQLPIINPSTAPVDVVDLTLCLGGHETSVGGGARFIELVGRPLVRLQINVAEVLPPSGMRTILRSCPSLRSLSVEGFDGCVDTAEFLEAYRASDLHLEVLACDFNDVPMLLDELADVGSRLIRTLKRLKLEFSDDDEEEYSAPSSLSEDSATDDEHCNRVTDMLEANQTLEYVKLVLYQAVSEDARIRFFHQDMTPLPVVRKAPPLACRLAFLFVLRTATNENEARVDLENHRELVAAIFHFASEPVLRRLVLDA
jgi:hypothetical protein